MVSGFVTSPCDQLRIFSGDAKLMRIASKSAIGFARSKGLERYKVILRFLLSKAVPSTEYQVTEYHCRPCSADRESSWSAERFSSNLFFPIFQAPYPRHVAGGGLSSIGR